MKPRPSLVVVTAFAVIAGCHRTPEEFAPPASSNSASLPQASQGADPPRKPQGCPPDPEPKLVPLPEKAALKIPDAEGGPLSLDVEVARSEHDTSRGLMYRTEMPEMHGMLFELDRSDHAFWMHNTCMPLDLLYIDRGVIVGIVESAPILNDDPRAVGKPSEEVLELGAGFCRRHGVNVGHHVTRTASSG